jgi:hypothetical protein
VADNPQVDPGATPSVAVAADDCASVFYQRVKLTDGTADSTTPIKSGGGVEADALRVTIANDSTGVVSIDDNGGAITVDGTVAVTNAGLTTLAGAVAGTEMQVDVLTMPTVTVNSHAVTNAGTFAVQAVLGAGTAEVGKLAAGTALIGKVGIDQTTPGTTNKVSIGTDGTVVLGAGSAAIGKLGANSGVDIGDVDVASVVPGAGATNLGKAEDAAHSSGDVGVMALAVRTDTPAARAGAAADYIPLTTDKVGALWTASAPATPFKNIDCDESEDAISANPCILKGFYAYANVAAGTKRYLKFYNATTGNVTVGTTVPDMTIELDGTQGIVWSTPLLFATALTVAATTGLADNDSGAPGANEVIICGGYSDL